MLTMKNTIQLIIILFATSFFSACDNVDLCPLVTIPETDVTAPIFTFKIDGPGMHETLAIHEGWSGGSMVLLGDSDYRFVFSASDEGGTRMVRMQVPSSDFFDAGTLRPSSATKRDISFLSQMLELRANDEEIRSCLIMSGDFHTGDLFGTSANIGFIAFDYGGASRTSNTTTRDLSITLTDNPDNVSFTDF